MRSAYHHIISNGELYGLEVAMGALDTYKNSIIPMENKQNIIPARATLMKRRLIGDPFCHFCKVVVEHTSHLFFECRCFAHIWEAPPFYLQLPDAQWNFGAWIRWFRSKLDGAAFELACVIC